MPLNHSRSRESSPLVQGESFWKKGVSPRFSLLVDAAAYYRAFTDAASRAERTIFILGWDLDSRISLLRHEDSETESDTLLSHLTRLLREKPRLHIRILIWDFSVIYALERESLTRLKLQWSGLERLHFQFDDHHPLGGSHHQKIVTVDDRIAFVGGIDLTARRWDTPAHRSPQPLRTAPNGDPFPPFHDVQTLFDGDPARHIGELVRDRWKRATGETVAMPSRGEEPRNDPWPSSSPPDVREAPLAVVRTDPAYMDRPAVRETENFLLRAIDQTRRSLYIENQYLTSARVGEAIRRKLEERNGPRIVIVTPRFCRGWLQHTTMDGLRWNLLRSFREADHEGRLRVVYPVVEGDHPVYVHSKVVIAEDRYAFISSANLNNRSMGLDTECGVVLDAESEPRLRREVERFRDRLLREHLGSTEEEIHREFREHGSLTRLVDSHSGGERRLLPVSGEVSELIQSLVPYIVPMDPEKPVELKDLVNGFLYGEE